MELVRNMQKKINPSTVATAYTKQRCGLSRSGNSKQNTNQSQPNADPSVSILVKNVIGEKYTGGHPQERTQNITAMHEEFMKQYNYQTKQLHIHTIQKKHHSCLVRRLSTLCSLPATYVASSL